MKLDFTSLAKAQESLGKAIHRALKEPSDEELRDAVIQRFEYTFELSWKMMKRVIESESAIPSMKRALSKKSKSGWNIVSSETSLLTLMTLKRPIQYLKQRSSFWPMRNCYFILCVYGPNDRFARSTAQTRSRNT
jgi:hypothetical protein